MFEDVESMIEGIVGFLSVMEKENAPLSRVGLFSGAFPGDPVTGHAGIYLNFHQMQVVLGARDPICSVLVTTG